MGLTQALNGVIAKQTHPVINDQPWLVSKPPSSTSSWSFSSSNSFAPVLNATICKKIITKWTKLSLEKQTKI